jgi:hypothetical protein
MRSSVEEGFREFDDMLKAKGACFQCHTCEQQAKMKFIQFVRESERAAFAKEGTLPQCK